MVQLSMKKILTQIFVTLGVIFLILIFIGIYFFITDPLNLRSMFSGSGPVPQPPKSAATEQATTENTPTTPTGGFQLSDAQKQALGSFGIDPATVPTSITAEQEACFSTALGEARVSEIKAGAVPNALEFFKAKSCI